MVNISQLLHPLIAVALDDFVAHKDAAERGDNKCLALEVAFVGCLNTAGLDRRAREACILCPIADEGSSRATTCKEFEAEGFCGSVEECKERDCPTACWSEFDEWLKCKLDAIDCPGLCQELGDDTLSIA